MADKEATVYIVDLGRSMGGKHEGRTVSDLDFALNYVWEKITSTVSNTDLTATIMIDSLGRYRSQDCKVGRGRPPNG